MKKPPKQCFSCGGPHYARSCPATVCHVCVKPGHLARDCTFGKSLRPEDQFVLCSELASIVEDPPPEIDRKWGSTVGCFARCFVMPMHGSFRTDFDPVGDLSEGRV